MTDYATTLIDAETIASTTYTIRRPGCTAWAEHLPAPEVAAEYRHAEDLVRGHEIIGEHGPLGCETVTVQQIEDALEYLS